MDRHLSQGCQACSRLMALMKRVHEESAAEPIVEERLVKAAKAVFPRRPALQVPGWMDLPRLAAALIFDSAASLVQEGARSASQSMLQTVYHAGDYAIELQFEREPESPEVALVGQVVNRAGSSRPVAGAAILLMARNKPLAQAESNAFGEFCLSARAQHGLKLCVHLDEIGRRLELPLTRIMAGRK